MAARNESVPSAGDMVVIKRVFDAPRWIEMLAKLAGELTQSAL